MAPPQKPKSNDTTYHPSQSTEPRSGATLNDPGKQVTRVVKQNGIPTFFGDIKVGNDAVEPQWSDRAAESVDNPAPPIIPGATNPPR
jgi:hypothetical protein